MPAGATANEAPQSQLFVVVEREALRMRMRVIPVHGGGEERVAAVNCDVGIAPLEVVGRGDPGTLSEVYHVFRRLDLAPVPGGDDRIARAFIAWQEALARSGIALRLERRALYGGPLSYVNWQADPHGISLRPWDVELTALAAGLRTIVKLDRIPPALVASLRDIVAARGLRFELVEPQAGEGEATDTPGSVTLLVARDAPELAEARGPETLLLARGGAPGATAATLEIGALLGYPPCCVERFVGIAEQNDTTLAWALLPGLGDAPASPLTQWLQPGLALLSHAPCDLHCAASLALGARILEAIEAGEPGFTARWHSIAARLQVVDQRGTRMAIAVDGPLETGATVTDADALASGGGDPDTAAHAAQLRGRTVIADAGGLVAREGGWYAPYVADHRAGLTTPA